MSALKILMEPIGPAVGLPIIYVDLDPATSSRRSQLAAELLADPVVLRVVVVTGLISYTYTPKESK